MHKLNNQYGFTFIEILVSLAVGILLLSAASAVGLASLASSKDTIVNGNGQQQMQIIMNTLTRDLRRAGYSATEETSKTPTAFRNIKFFDVDGNGSNDCIIFRYDKNAAASALAPPGNGTIEANEVRGIRLNNNQIQLITTATDTNLSATTPTSCNNAGTWETLSNTGLNVAELSLSPIKVMLMDGSFVVDQINISITANTKSNPPHPLNLTETIQLRNRPYSNN